MWNFEPVALKVISQRKRDEEYFKQEVLALHKITSRYVVRLIGICVSPYTIVLEYMEGGSLKDYISSDEYKHRSIAGLLCK